MDLIERQAAIDEIKNFKNGAAEWRDEQEDRSDIWHRADSAIASAIEIGLRIKKLPSAPRWIPVMKRLPEEDTDVLITGENGEVDIARWKYDSWTEDDVVVWEGSGYSYIDPVAWMPLPEPWKGGEDMA